MSTYSPSLRVELITQGDQAGTWGTTTNANFSNIFDVAIAGYQTVPVTSANQAFTYNNGPVSTASLNQSVYAMLRLTTTTTAAFAVYAPPVSKQYIIWNNSGYTATIYNSTVIGNTTAAGTGVSIADGDRVVVFSNGTNFYDVKGSNVTGTVAIANGGTGQTTANTAFNALAPSQTGNSGKYLTTNGTNTSWDAIDISTADITGTLAISNGGTGQTTYTNGELLIGNTTGNTLTKATLTAGTGIAITNGTGSITVGGAAATATDIGMVKLGDAAVQSVVANAVTTTASRSYALQVNASGQGVINVPWTDTVYSLPAATDSVLGGIKLGDATQQTTAANAVTATASRSYALQVNASGQGLVNVPWTDTVYSLPSATDTVLGGIKLGSATVQTVAASPVTTTASRTYALQVNAAGQGVVNVPWTDTATTFATDISVNTLTVGKGPNNPTGATTFGYQAGAAATASNVQQTAIGYRALASATTTAGVGNQWEGSTAVGYKALESSNPTSFASHNTAVGAAALLSTTTGFYNTAVGAGAASNVLTGTQVTAVGTFAGNQSTSGSFVAVGYNALAASINRTAGSVAIGTEALRIATTYSGNSAIFNENNTAVGYNTFYNLSAENSTLAGSNNTALGRSAGSALVSGSNNMMLGSNAQGSTTSISNEITLGNSSITTLRCQVTSITSLSDQRDKYDIEDLPLGLSFVNALRPRRYKWDKRDWYVDEIQHEDGTVETVTVPKDGSRAQTNWNEGFVAQEAKAALQAAGADWFPLVYESNPEKLEMSSGKLIPVLVKAIQELTARLEALEAK